MDPIPNIVKNDPWLNPFCGKIQSRLQRAIEKEQELAQGRRLEEFANGYLYYGMHRYSDFWVFREWAPNATAIYLLGEFSDWKENKKFMLQNIGNGNWEIKLRTDILNHTDLFRLSIHWNNGQGERIPAWATRVIQDPDTLVFNAQIWAPENKYQWNTSEFKRPDEPPLIYEAHVGMATEKEKTGSYKEFQELVLPRIIQAGYNTIQFMAIQEHPYYGSFGYHVSSFFAASSRFGTPEDLKALIDAAHEGGLSVIMDIVHSHAVKNEVEGLARFDGTTYQYFHDGPKGFHPAWDSMCFNYGKNEVLHFLLSNCKYWLDEYRFDGFRFDGVTSMIFNDHGLSRDFTSYEQYFDDQEDEDALSYLWLANKLIHDIRPDALTVAEEMSGMPGLAARQKDGGYGFDYRLAMGTPDYWIKLIKEKTDNEWPVDHLYHELSAHRSDEKTIGYSESHDQALVGDKTIFFRLVDKEMYNHMNKTSQSLIIDRGVALHKIIRLMTISMAGGGYLNFMGNEFGHPEWIDFPREGNNWSYKFARRQWSLAEDKDLKFHYLSDFDKDMINLVRNEKILEVAFPNKSFSNPPDQVFVVERGGLVFIFNLSPDSSYTDYGIPAKAGKYQMVLNTDDPAYGGFGNIRSHQVFYTIKPGKLVSDQPDYLMVYLPSRTAMVLKKIQSRSIHDLH